jgi:hypothetical protein
MSLDARAKFGKHKGKTRAWIQQNDWRYLEWAKLNVPNLFEENPQARSVQVDQKWGKPTPAPAVSRVEPPETDGDDPNSSSFMYNLAKRLLDKGEL